MNGNSVNQTVIIYAVTNIRIKEIKATIGFSIGTTCASPIAVFVLHFVLHVL